MRHGHVSAAGAVPNSRSHSRHLRKSSTTFTSAMTHPSSPNLRSSEESLALRATGMSWFFASTRALLRASRRDRQSTVRAVQTMRQVSRCRYCRSKGLPMAKFTQAVATFPLSTLPHAQLGFACELLACHVPRLLYLRKEHTILDVSKA